jgi:hypothetical protein
MFDEETWRPVPSVPGLLASSYGRIKIAPRTDPCARGGVRHFIGKPRLGSWNGHRYIFFWKVTGKTYKVHRLICEAFNGPEPSDKNLCMHLDENARNNRPENLQWGTDRENMNAPKLVERRFQLARQRVASRRENSASLIDPRL